MRISLKKAVFADCEKIHKMQVSAFTELLLKYQDYDTNPASESLERIQCKFNRNFTVYHFIMAGDVEIGVVRIVKLSEEIHRISPIFILPEFQNKGYAQKALEKIESFYSDVKEWQLDTIKQEAKLCHLYEKCGYVKTGKEEDIKDGMTVVYLHKKKLDL